jgi:hypothetical protein
VYLSFKGDSIYRAREPNWLGKYQNSKEKFADYNTETKMLKGAEKQPANKGQVVHLIPYTLSHILDVGTKPDIELPYCQRSTCILDQPILEVGRCLFCFLTYPLS